MKQLNHKDQKRPKNNMKNSSNSVESSTHKNENCCSCFRVHHIIEQFIKASKCECSCHEEHCTNEGQFNKRLVSLMQTCVRRHNLCECFCHDEDTRDVNTCIECDRFCCAGHDTPHNCDLKTEADSIVDICDNVRVRLIQTGDCTHLVWDSNSDYTHQIDDEDIVTRFWDLNEARRQFEIARDKVMCEGLNGKSLNRAMMAAWPKKCDKNPPFFTNVIGENYKEGCGHKDHNYIVLWKLGNIDHGMIPTQESIDKLKEILSGLDCGNNVEHVVWGSDLTTEVIKT